MLDLLLIGALIILIAWGPMLLTRAPLSIAIVCTGLGAAGALIDPQLVHAKNLPPEASEWFAKLALIVALMGSALKIDRPLSFKGWETTWRLLAIAMPLTIVAMLLLCINLGDFALPSALLIAAALAPTDPVLASEVAVGPPLKGEEGEIRFGLTSEAGLNDGLAFPFVQLAIALGAASIDAIWAKWILVDFIGKGVGGLACGVLIGWVAGFLVFHSSHGRMSETNDGLIALGLSLLTYAVAELAHLNGFLGVFVMAMTLRWRCPQHRFHVAMAKFVGQVERLLTMLLLVFFGAALSLGLLDALGWRDALLAVLFILVIRPVIGWFSLLGSPHPPISRALTAFFGIRGIGSLYYFLYSLRGETFPDEARLWALGGLVILLSILLHGATATPLMAWADRIRTNQ